MDHLYRGLTLLGLDRLRPCRACRSILELHPDRRPAGRSAAAQLLAQVQRGHASTREPRPATVSRALVYVERREPFEPAVWRARQHHRCPRQNFELWTSREHVVGNGDLKTTGWVLSAGRRSGCGLAPSVFDFSA